jgi:hypothetical protein
MRMGEPTGYSAMAETVGTPCAFAVELVLSGALPGRGVLRPVRLACTTAGYGYAVLAASSLLLLSPMQSHNKFTRAPRPQVTPDVYNPLLEKLAAVGITFIEEERWVHGT